MRVLLKISLFIIPFFCLSTSALADQHMQPPNGPGAMPSPADMRMMDNVASSMMMMSTKRMGRRMMMMGVRMYVMGKTTMMMKNINMAGTDKMMPKKMMMMGMEMYKSGKMMAGKPMSKNDFKKMMMK